MSTAKEKLEALKQQALQKFAEADSSKTLYEQKVYFLGKNGVFTEIMKEMASLPKE